MTADPTAVAVMGLGIGGVLALYNLRRVVLSSSRGGQKHSWVLVSLLEVRNPCCLAGILFSSSRRLQRGRDQRRRLFSN